MICPEKCCIPDNTKTSEITGEEMPLQEEGKGYLNKYYKGT